MMLRSLFPGLLLLTALLGLWQAFRLPKPSDAAPPSKDEPAAGFSKDVVPFLTKYCYACHGNGKRRGDLALDPYTDEQAVQQNRKLWENVQRMIRTGEMPPQGKPRPDDSEAAAVLRSLDAVLARYDCTGPRPVGRVTVRRLNKAEYNNTIRDLVGVDFQPAADFPNDDTGYGFDNIGDVLSLSPLLLEKYLAAAEQVVEKAILNPDPPKSEKRLFRSGQLRPLPRKAGEYRKLPATLLHSKGEIVVQNFLAEGDYVLRVEAFGTQVGKEPVRMAIRVDDRTIKEFVVKAVETGPVKFEARTRLQSGTTQISAAFLNPHLPPGAADPQKEGRLLHVRSVEIEGPFNAPAPVLPESHQRIMARKDGLSARAAAREIVARFAARAFRRPLQPGEAERYLKLYDQAEKEGLSFEGRIRLALQGVLASPHFLFRIELDPPDAKPQTANPVSEFELASRLSYFLWSSMPDEELLALAAKGRLHAGLDAQVRRMLQDPKSTAFVRNFAGQWLTTRNLADAAPDPERFPQFDEELRAAMIKETELFFDAILREGRSILDLLDADFSFVNERLARHYGIAGVKGMEFQRVKLPAPRSGILTHGSILTLTSNPTRTSPVKRGKWVLEQILGTPPPPPPPDAGDLDEDPKQLAGALRQRMEQHRAKPVCASCHNRMDPLGFAFENFDAVGAWREQDGKFAIDPSGVLPDGKSFKGPAELKQLLRGQKELFARCLTEKMLTYALGRGLEYHDRCAVDKVLEVLARNDYRLSALVAEVTRSEPFRMRTATGGK